MTSILLSVTGAQAWATVTGPLTSGMVGIPITIECDAAWDGLTKNLVCRCSEWGSDSAEQRTILNVGETAVVAHEVMKAGLYLYLGIEGYSSDGKLVIPTTWARCGEIQYGANAGTEIPADPTLPVWEQLQAEIGQFKQDVVTKEQMVGIMDSVQSATQAAAISAGRAEAAAKRAEEAASGGSSVARWVKRATATITEEETQRIKFDVDLDGNPLNIDKTHRWVVESGNVNYSANSYVDLQLNKNWSGGTTNSVACRVNVYTDAVHLSFTAKPFPTGQFVIQSLCANPGTQNVRTNVVLPTTPYSYDGENINIISVMCKSGTYFKVGSTFAVWEEVFE